MHLQTNFQNLFETIKSLRGANGCPWDIAQTPTTMKAFLFEETCEALDAITENDVQHVKEELGDILLNVLMTAYMYEQQEDFTVSDMLQEVNNKLIRRHPHVFSHSEGSTELRQDTSTPEKVLEQWAAIKENIEGRKKHSILDEVSNGFPPLLRAYKMQKKAAKQGFDWTNIDDVKVKVFEEMQEIEQAVVISENMQNAKESLDDIELEVGDLLFAVVNYARHLKVDPSIALQRTNNKFYNRFCYIEKKMKELHIPLSQENFVLMDELWDAAKKHDK
ncbi:MAG: nucleoside triphosphate pyrophosphohydrolase [Treponemataceae bacterium]